MGDMFAYDADKYKQCEILVAIFWFDLKRQKRGVPSSDRLEQVRGLSFLQLFSKFLNLNLNQSDRLEQVDFLFRNYFPNFQI